MEVVTTVLLNIQFMEVVTTVLLNIQVMEVVTTVLLNIQVMEVVTTVFLNVQVMEVVTTVLLNIQVFCDIAPCHTVSSSLPIFKDHSAFQMLGTACPMTLHHITEHLSIKSNFFYFVTVQSLLDCKLKCHKCKMFMCSTSYQLYDANNVQLVIL